jgi:nucleoid-associated protein YgaU
MKETNLKNLGGKLMAHRNTAFLTLIFVLALTLVVGSFSLFAQEKMGMDEYRAQLQDWQAKEAAARQAAEQCAQDVEGLKGEIQATDAEIEKVWSETLAAIGTDQAGYEAYKAKLTALDAEVDGLLALSPEELFKKREDIKAAEEQLAELKKDKLSVLTEMQNLTATVEGKLTQVKNKMPKAIYDEYTVMVGDYLWRISGKADIYNDPTHWMRIYSYNKDQIKDPDLIYPQQVFKIQREVGPEEYLVAKGDYLAKIAEKPDVFGDAASWTKIYEKNKDVIGEDANMIYPYTVLVIPKD